MFNIMLCWRIAVQTTSGATLSLCVLLVCLQVCAAPDQLLSAVNSLDTSKLKPFPAKDACGIIDKMDDFMGRHRAAS
jgi:hypothetical protein